MPCQRLKLEAKCCRRNDRNQRYQLHLDFMDMEGLWGVFGSSANRNGGSFLQTDPTLG